MPRRMAVRIGAAGPLVSGPIGSTSRRNGSSVFGSNPDNAVATGASAGSVFARASDDLSASKYRVEGTTVSPGRVTAICSRRMRPSDGGYVGRYPTR